MTDLTLLEHNTLAGIYASEYHAGNYGHPSIWRWAVRAGGVAKRQLPGVISSLQRKGFVQCDGDGKEATITVTETGHAYAVAHRIPDALDTPPTADDVDAETAKLVRELKKVARDTPRA